MNRRLSLLGAAVLSATCLAFAGGGPPFMKWSDAKKQAAATGKPIMVYSQVDSKGAGVG